MADLQGTRRVAQACKPAAIQQKTAQYALNNHTTVTLADCTLHTSWDSWLALPPFLHLLFACLPGGCTCCCWQACLHYCIPWSTLAAALAAWGFPLSDLRGLMPPHPLVGNATRVVADMSTCNLLPPKLQDYKPHCG